MFKIRKKRFNFRVPCIKVPTDAAVSYEDSIVRVVRGSVSLYRFLDQSVSRLQPCREVSGILWQCRRKTISRIWYVMMSLQTVLTVLQY